MLKPVALSCPFRHDGGSAYVADLPPDFETLVGRGDVFFLLQEGDRELGPGDCVHQAIRDRGNGRFSVWQNSIYFSSSDNSSCQTNGRLYSLFALELSEESSLLKTLLQRMTLNDGMLLGAVAQNATANNTVFANFFRYHHGISHWIRRSGSELPKTILEIGCGATPYTALRFLLEGVERYVVNDVMSVSSTFPVRLISDLRTCCNQLAPELDSVGEKILLPGQSTCGVRGLEVHSAVPFENISATGPFDFITSTSVMEHVMAPDAVFAKMAELCPTGGFVYHSIDLRDHRDFNLPLDFLRLTEQDYSPHATENRLRSSDFAELFERNGFEFVEGNWYMLAADNRLVWTNNPTEIPPGVTVAERDGFVGRFAAMDLTDLSTLAVQWLLRKK